MSDEKKITPFWFTFRFKGSGIVDSDMNLEDSLKELHAEFTAIYGEGGYEVLDFHEATQEELAQYEHWVSEMSAQVEALDPDTTLN